MGSRVRLKDIAAAAGVSPSMVSLVLNDRPARVSPEKRELILRTAERLHYVPNQAARSLATRRSMMIALVVPDIENMFFASLAKGIEDVAAADGYSVIVANTNDSREREHSLLAGLASRGVDGIFLVPGLESCADIDGLRSAVEDCPCPVVLVDRLIEVPWCDGVSFDGRAGGRIAAEALLDAGHTRIGCVSGGKAGGRTDYRYHGFVDRLHEAGLFPSEAMLAAGDYRFSSGYDEADAVLGEGATAVFCANDLMALGFLKRMEERGLRCPQDVSVVGYDDVLARFGMTTNLTTVRQDTDELAAACWRTLSECMSGVSRQPVTELLAPRLVVRDTVAGPRGQ